MPPSLPGLAPKSLWKSSSQRAGFGTSVQEGSLPNLLVGARASPERAEEVLEPGCGSSDLPH